MPRHCQQRVLIAAFDNFDYVMFWQAWRRYCAFTHAADTPEPVEGCAEAALIMEFFLHLRFAMAPWLQQQGQQQHQQQQAPLNAIDLGTGTWIGEGGVVSSQGQPAPPPGAKQAMEVGCQPGLAIASGPHLSHRRVVSTETSPLPAHAWQITRNLTHVHAVLCFAAGRQPREPPNLQRTSTKRCWRL